MAMVEGCRRTGEICNVVGVCIGVPTRGSVVQQPVLLPELRHTLELAREIPAHRRLSLREQGELRSAYSRNSTPNAFDPAHITRG